MHFMVVNPLNDGPKAVTDQADHRDAWRAHSMFVPAIEGAGADTKELGRRLAVEKFVRQFGSRRNAHGTKGSQVRSEARRL